MFPVNLLGDAASAEEMVKQVTRTGRPSQNSQNEIFERLLRLALEESRLSSVRPATEITESNPTPITRKRQRRKKKHRRFLQDSTPLFRAQPHYVHEDMQPLLFDTYTSGIVESYHQSDRAPDLGHIVDRKA